MYKIKFLDGSVRGFKSLREADLEGANLRGADLEGADLREANLRGADLRGADLREASLSRANLHKADLRGAKLRGADLRGVGLGGAQLDRTCIFSFNLGKHFGFYHEGYLKIGCQGHNVDEWTEEFTRKLGKREGYSDNEIEVYLAMLDVVKKRETRRDILGFPEARVRPIEEIEKEEEFIPELEMHAYIYHLFMTEAGYE